MVRYKKTQRSLFFEELEPRLLFSADVAEPLAVDAAQEQSYEDDVVGDQCQARLYIGYDAAYKT